MFDDPAELRRKAEVRRGLANMSDREDRKFLWLERATHWEDLAIKAMKQPRAAKA